MSTGESTPGKLGRPLHCGHPEGCWQEDTHACGWCLVELRASFAESELVSCSITMAEMDLAMRRQDIRCKQFQSDLAELECTFHLRWQAERRACAMWHAAHPDSPVGIPDRVDMLYWLLTVLERHGLIPVDV